MLTKILPVLFFVLITLSELNAQPIETWIEQNEKLPVEKLYLQTDKEFYFAGEQIWFKTYLTDSRSGQLIPSAENIYVNLINSEGIPVMKSVIMSVNGQAPGDLTIPVDINAGTYLLEGYTDYLLNFGANTFFYKPVNISRITPSARLAGNNERFSRSQQMVGDVSFLPEGGVLLSNVSNLVAFKAINTDGYGVEAKGLVKDQNGSIISEFQTDYKGMGLFFFTPERGKFYTAYINGFPSFKFDFKPLIAEEGVKLQVVNHSNNDLIVNIAGNSEKFIGEKHFLVNMHRGEVIFYHAFKYESLNHVLKFNSENLKQGINRLVLLDKDLVPVSERLVFSDNFEVNNILVNPDTASYFPRSRVTLDISDQKRISPDEFSNLSVSVLHENAISQFGESHNILSYFLLNSELNGFIEQSADYFTDKNISSTAKIRLLMLTNGWSSYVWNTVPGATDTIQYKPKIGIDIKGTAFNSLNESPVENGEITLIIEKDGEMAFLTQNTNKQGEFIFPGLLFNDTAKAYIQARNKRGKMNTSISMSAVFPVPDPSKNHIEGLNSFYKTPYMLQKQKYESDLAQREFDPYYRTRNIDQVDIFEKKPKKDEHFRIYDEPDQVVEVPKNEMSYSNVLEFMTGKVTGLDVSLDDVHIRGISALGDNSTPLFLIDGVPVLKNINIEMNEPGADNTDDTDVPEDNRISSNSAVEKVKSLPLRDIEKVEILKSPQNLALFGSEGANGVIAIYTRRGEDANPNPYIKGLIEQKIQGYTSNKKFYSPIYTPENQNNPKPDLRTTLFWEPEISTQEDTVNLQFNTSDQTGRYKIIVEGITNAGKICLGTADFEVVNIEAKGFNELNP